MNPNVNAFIKWFASTLKQGRESYADKKIELREILAFLPAAMMVAELIEKADAAWDEIKNSDTAKIASMLNDLDKELSYLTPEVRSNIRNIAGTILFGIVAVSNFKTATPEITDGESSAQ